MLSLSDRIKLLESDVVAEPPRFIMARELPFAIFRYDPLLSEENEWLVRGEIHKLATRVENKTKRKVGILSLADLFWESIYESEGLDALVSLEKEHGFEAAQRQVNRYLSDPDFWPLCNSLTDAVRKLKSTSVIFLIHATAFAPGAYRVSSLLEQMSGKLTVPTVLFYPGKWNHTLNYMGLRSEDQALGSYRVKIYGRES